MTFSLQILVVSIVFCVLALTLLVVLKEKAVTITLLVLSGLFITASSFYCFTEYSAYQKRMERHYQRTSDLRSKQTVSEESGREYDTYRRFKEYKNALSGYEMFLTEIGQRYLDIVSYQNTLRNEIMYIMANNEYGETYWNTVFDIVFRFDKNTTNHKMAGYSAMYFIPIEYKYHDFDEDFGDLDDPDNYAFFEKVSQTAYLEKKIKTFDRSSENIDNLWALNKSYIYTYFTKSRYDKLCKNVVDDLIEVHDSVVVMPNYKEFYEKYDVSDDAFYYFPSVEFTRSFSYTWPFSFWDRRFSENNAPQVYAILKEVQDHYKD